MKVIGQPVFHCEGNQGLANVLAKKLTERYPCVPDTRFYATAKGVVVCDHPNDRTIIATAAAWAEGFHEGYYARV